MKFVPSLILDWNRLVDGGEEVLLTMKSCRVLWTSSKTWPSILNDGQHYTPNSEIACNLLDIFLCDLNI